MIVYEFADGSWTDAVSAAEDSIDVSTAVLTAEVSQQEWESSQYALFAARALDKAREWD